MKSKYVYQAIANAVVACGNCINSGNSEWQAKWENQIEAIVKKFMPSGSGFDGGTQFHMDDNLKHNGEKLVFSTAFHHMNENGMYDGWTEHVVTVTPSFDGFRLKISGSNRDEIKDYIHETFSAALDQENDILPV